MLRLLLTAVPSLSSSKATKSSSGSGQVLLLALPVSS
jgi:hypothetical protein